MRELDPACPSRHVGFDHEHLQAFRGSVHGGRETCGPCPHNDEIPYDLRIDRLVEAKTLRNTQIRRITEDRVRAAQQYRNIARRDIKSIKQFLRFSITIQVDVLERMAVPTEKLPHA